MRLLYILLLLLSPAAFQAQSLTLLTQGKKVSFRGLSVVSDQVIWASGTGGTVTRSVDGGRNWEWLTVKGFEKTDFRDIEAFDEKTAVIMGVADPAFILRTTDGGKSWKTVYTDTTKGVFLDAMAFQGKFGVAVGDPLGDPTKMYVLSTFNGGRSWHKYPAGAPAYGPLAEKEAMFASSGTNLVLFREFHQHARQNLTYVVTGGGAASFFNSSTAEKQPLPLIQGKESTGANSIAAWNMQRLYVVGGDFMHDKDTTGNACYSDDGGKTWNRPLTPPHGYRSCVIYTSKDQLVSCGTSGVDLSTDGGQHWTLVAPDSYHVCQKAKNGSAVFLAGGNGKIARLHF